MRGEHLVRLAKHLLLDGRVLGDGLDHQVGAVRILQPVDCADALHHVVGGRPALLGEPAETAAHRVERAIGRARLRVEERDLGKEPAEARDFPGFVSNRILMPFVNEAAYVLMEGVAEPEAIDTIAKLGFAHPMGPLALADLIGLDTCVAIMDVLHEGLDDPRFEPAALLREHVAAGRFGRKSGEGFFSY